MGHLTRAEMEEVIRQGGSVLHNNYTHTSIATLPTVADLALGDVDAENAADAAIEDQMRALLAQRTKLANEREQRAAREKHANRAKLEETRARVREEEREPTEEERRDMELREKRVQGELPPSEEGLDSGTADHPITQLPDQGDRISQTEREEEHAQATSGDNRPEGEPERPPDREGESAPPQSEGSGGRAVGDGDEGSKGKTAPKSHK